jgi:hypothetical protein
LKTQTKRDGRLRQDCATTVGWPTRRFVPALRKGGLRKGPGRMCRRSKASRAGKRGMAKNNIVQETPEGRTCKKHRRARPECDHSISDQGTRQRLLPKREKTQKGHQAKLRSGNRDVNSRVKHRATRTGGLATW